MKVSVILPTYRRDAELARALESLAGQTMTDLEILVVDDNDNAEWNDKVERVVQSFEQSHPAVCLRYVQNHPNLGSAKARNVGIAEASGAYITFLDDDDIYLPEKVERQYRFMTEGDYEVSVTDLALYFEDERLSEHRKRAYLKNTDKDSLLRYHLMYHITGTDTMMFDTAYLRSIGGFAPIDIGDEYYLMQRAIEGGGRFGYLPDCSVKAYVHEGEAGLSAGQSKIDGENSLFAYKKQYFDHLDRGSRRYVRTRHHAVLAFAYLRMKKYGAFLVEGIHAMLISPSAGIRILRDRG